MNLSTRISLILSNAESLLIPALQDAVRKMHETDQHSGEIKAICDMAFNELHNSLLAKIEG